MAVGAVMRVQTDSASHMRTKAEQVRDSCLMDVVLNFSNLMASHLVYMYASFLNTKL